MCIKVLCYLSTSCDWANVRVEVGGVWKLVQNYVGDVADECLLVNRVLDLRHVTDVVHKKPYSLNQQP